MEEPLRIVQISDIHLFEDKNNSLLGVKTQESFEAVLRLLKSNKTSPHCIILSGDLTQDGSENAYVRLADAVSEFQVPVYCVAGNHDDGDMLKKVFPCAMISPQKNLVFDHWQLILLDSQKPNAVEGFLDKSQLNFLEECLKKNPKHRAIIVFHHHPVSIGCAWLDNLGLQNSDELWKVLKKYPQVHAILFGHVHQQCEGKINGVEYYSAPSTCIQFKTKSKEFALDHLPPGYRLIELHSDGKFETSVHRAPKYVGEFSENAKGY